MEATNTRLQRSKSLITENFDLPNGRRLNCEKINFYLVRHCLICEMNETTRAANYNLSKSFAASIVFWSVELLKERGMEMVPQFSAN